MKKNNNCQFDMDFKYSHLHCYDCVLRDKCELGTSNYKKGLANSAGRITND